MQRVVIIGSGGAGKSTLARQLGRALELPIIHLDSLFWKPGWTETPRPQWKRTVGELTARDRWIIDGNYGSTMELSLAAADTIVFLDFPRLLCIWRVIRRVIEYSDGTRPDMGPGCPEKVDREFLQWIWNYPEKNRPTVLERIEKHRDGKQVHRLRSPGEVKRFLNQLETKP